MIYYSLIVLSYLLSHSSAVCVPNPDAVCPTADEDYDPLCCEGERQYSNQCEAESNCEADCVAGGCGGCTPNPDGVCSTEVDRVCCLGVEYSNPCNAVLDCATGCVSGGCTPPVANGPCPEEFSPVCCNGNTYVNECEAAGDQPCTPGECIAGPCVPQDVSVCPQEVFPLCCNGQKYQNPCFAELNCVLDSNCVQGDCPSARMVNMDMDIDDMADIDLQLLLLNATVSAVTCLFVIASGLTVYILLKKCKGKKYVVLDNQDIDSQI